MEYKYSNNSYDTMPTTVNDTKLTIVITTENPVEAEISGQQSGEFPSSDNKKRFTSRTQSQSSQFS